MPSDPSRAVRVRVPAKVNLHLSVGPVRPDGYHELETVFHAVDLCDEVTATPAAGPSVTVSGEGADDLPTDGRNLAWRAAALLAETVGVAPNVHLDLHKAIPVAGGMAGGSADAAATLHACAALWDVEADLSALAARLGADVAFPLAGGTAIGTGRGERLQAIGARGTLHWVFALADFGILAADAYRELDRLRAAGQAPRPVGPPDELVAALVEHDHDLDRIAALLANDLQAAALSLQPALAETLAAGVAAGARAGIVSGSGPTCAFLCADADATRAVADGLLGRCRGVRIATGPCTTQVAR